MSCMTTSMSGGPTLAAEDWSIQELLTAGWSEADLAWERVAEEAAEAVAHKDFALAKSKAGEALQMARAGFEPIDPRLGTSLANYGVCLHAVRQQRGRGAPVSSGARRVASGGPVDRPHGRAADARAARCFTCAWSCVTATPTGPDGRNAGKRWRPTQSCASRP